MNYPIFDAIESERRKQDGIALAVSNAESVAWRVQQIAVDVGKRQRFVSADDVVREYVRRGITHAEAKGSNGGMFRGKGWHITDRSVKSERADAHARRLPLWEYRGQ